MNPWDFTLYKSTGGDLILKVVFSEGAYKTDVGRYFEIGSTNIEPNDIEDLKSLAEDIRRSYPDVSLREVSKSDVTVLK
jgi:hypothetical protein